MRVRTLELSDLDEVWRINQAEVPAVGDVSAGQLGDVIDQAIIALVVADADTIGGFCVVLPPDTGYESLNYRWFVERYDDFIYLDRVAISPHFQGRGFGRRLYEEVELRASELRPDTSIFALEVNLVPRNDPSLAFHDRLGFEIVGTRTPREDYSVAMMIKHLPHRSVPSV